MNSDETKAGERIGQLLRELGSMLIEPSDEEARTRPQASVSIERTARVAGLQALLLPIVTAPLLLVVEPTGPIGDLGWVLALACVASVVVIGFLFTTRTDVSTRALAASNIHAAGVLGTLGWLTGGLESPYPLLLPLVASSIAPHRPRVRRGLIAWIFLVISAPLVYDAPATAAQVAEIIMIASVSLATLFTMIWLSTRAGRSEAGLMDAVTTAQVAQQQLVKQTDLLLEAGEVRDRLVTRVSHELSTPLTSVKGYVEALIEGEGGDLDPQQRELAAVALRNTVRLELLIADLLLLSRVEAGQLELRPESLELRKALEVLREDLGQMARDNGVTLIVEAPKGLDWVVDQERLEQAVANLVSNAIKYTPGGGPVLIRARQVGSQLWIEVVDKGVGIPEDEIGRLGERFFRASTAGDASGSGLGISITQELVDLHRGELEIESEVGSGSIFRIRVPAGLETALVGKAEGEPDGLE